MKKDKEQPKTPLDYAIDSGDRELIDALVKAGADIKKSKAPLQLALNYCDFNTVVELVKEGADIFPTEEEQRDIDHEVCKAMFEAGISAINNGKSKNDGEGK